MKKRLLLLVCTFLCLSLSSSLHSQNDVHLLGDQNDNQFLSVKAYGDLIYAAGRVDISTNEFHGTFSCINPNSGQVLWTTMLPFESTLIDFIQDRDGFFIVVGRTEPINNGGWQNVQSLAARFDPGGNLVQSRIYEFDSTGGRETLSRIIVNPNPADDNFPYYVAGVVDRDDTTNPTAFDDVLLVTMDEGLNLNLVEEITHDLMDEDIDDEFIRGVYPLLNGSGDILMVGGIDRNDSNDQEIDREPVMIVVNNLGNVVQNWSYDTNFYQHVHDALVLPNGDYIFVGHANGNSNFITKTDANFNDIWQFFIPGFNRFDRIIEFNGWYYTIMRDENTGDRLISRFTDMGQTLQLDWTRTLNDSDFPISNPFIVSLNEQLIYGDRRIPNVTGVGTATGFGQEDILLAVTDEELTSCITEDVETGLEDREVRIFEFDVFNREIQFPVVEDNFDREELNYQNEPYCEEECGGAATSQVSFSCVNGADYTFNINFTSANTNPFVTGVSITNVSTPNVTISPTFFNFFFNAIPPGGTSANQTITVSFNSPIIQPTQVCFDVAYSSEDGICCTYEHCLTVMPDDPCEDVSATQSSTADECCYDVDLQNNYCADFFTGIRTEVLTPGVTITANNFSNWTPSTTNTVTSIDWDYNPGNGLLPLGSISGINFCLDGVTSPNQIPQQVAIHWLAVDPATGLEVIVCTDTLSFNCEPCMTVTDSVFCDANGNVVYNFTVFNSTSAPTGIALDLQSQTLNAVFTPAGFNGLTVLPGGSYSNQSVVTGVPSGTLVTVELQLHGTNPDGSAYCCHILRTFTTPNCGTFNGGGEMRVDNQPSNGIQQSAKIRLQPEGNDGLKGLVQTSEDDKEINLFPNPATDQIFLTVEKGGLYQIEIINLNGQIMSKGSKELFSAQRQSLEISELSDGVYFVRIVDEEGTHSQRRFVKTSK